MSQTYRSKYKVHHPEGDGKYYQLYLKEVVAVFEDITRLSA
jgi:hypothetical protein